MNFKSLSIFKRQAYTSYYWFKAQSFRNHAATLAIKVGPFSFQNSSKKIYNFLTAEVPKIDGLEQKYYVKELGNELEVDCVASGAPTPDIVWNFGGGCWY